MPIVMLIVFVIVLYLIFGRGGFRPPWWYESEGHHGRDEILETPLDILRRRYASGEITKEQFEQMKKEILN